MRARGVDVVSLSVGEPDFATPEHVITAAQKALADGQTRYTSVGGVTALREAVAEDSALRRGGHVHRASEIVVSAGAKHALFNIASVLLGPGDEAIVPTPCWVSYPDQIRLAGARARLVETTIERGFKLTPGALEEAIGDKTRALFLCTPSNPTGIAYTASELSALAEVMRAHDFWIVLDEIYAALVYKGFQQRSLLEVAPDLRERVIIVDGVSKRFAMTGFRIGWLLAPERVASAAEALQSQVTTNPASVSQFAALAALRGPQDCVETMRKAFEARRDLALEQVAALPDVSCVAPDGAFYLFLDVHRYLGRSLEGRALADDVALAEALLEEARVATVPGSAFLAPGHLRISYATGETALRQGLTRISELLAKLR